MKKFCILFLSVSILMSSFTLFAQEEHKTGFEPAPKEKLDKIKPFEETTFKGEMKSVLDMSDDFPPVGDQGNQNSCVAWAISYVLSYYHHNSYTSYYISTGIIDCSTIFSPAFIYNPLNFCTNMPILFPDGLDFVKENGVIDQCEMPYQATDYCSKPTKDQYNKAYSNRITQYYYANTKITYRLLKEKLSEGYPILIGVYVDNYFVTTYKQTSRSYVWGEYRSRDVLGHAMVIVGYNDNIKAFKVMNSWGTSWGESGFIWIDYDFVPNCIVEAYYIEK